jgi:hypothetical protein
MSNLSTAVVAVLDDVPALVPIADAAAALRVHPKTLVRENRRGRLRLVQVGARKFVTASDFAKYIAPK